MVLATPSNETTECSKLAPKVRIHEAINSTRRWHRDHKTTWLSDGEFTANYLKQQCKRDPALAVLIQKAILPRVRRRPGATLHPQTLEEFCQKVAWEDVTEAVEELLVDNVKATTKALR